MPAESVAVIAAVAQNNVIGAGNALPWDLPEDLAHFRALTLGHTLIMGRRTFESIGHPLPGRRTIVLTRAQIPGFDTTTSLDQALEDATGIVFIAGGSRVFAEGLKVADTLHLTRVTGAPQGDAFFPDYDPGRWHLVSSRPFDGGVFERHRAAHSPIERTTPTP